MSGENTRQMVAHAKVLGVYHSPDGVFHLLTMLDSVIDSCHFGCKRKHHSFDEFEKQRVADSLF